MRGNDNLFHRSAIKGGHILSRIEACEDETNDDRTMGAGQSSESEAHSDNATGKIGYYTLLNIERSATEEEIKKAYRKKALELHPDRNHGNEEFSTRQFAEVQSAYEVLSDPQERAWYDSHESAILRGDDGNSEDFGGNNNGHVYEGSIKVTSADDLARMMNKFNRNVSFTDSPDGFFGYLREIFEQLAKEEDVAVQINDIDHKHIVDYPSFGLKDDQYDDVVKSFYNIWSSFGTKKSFRWKDKFRLSEAPDRRYRRAMEKENQKSRDEAIREFNDAVRTFVAFVKKRDPRYIPTNQSEEERRQILRDAAARQAQRDRERHEALMKKELPDWAKIIEKDENEGEIEESESDEEHYECVACRKTFKSENQWEAHERSKKHQKAIQSLRQKMKKDNEKLGLDVDEDDEEHGDEDDDQGDEVYEAENHKVEEGEKKIKGHEDEIKIDHQDVDLTNQLDQLNMDADKDTGKSSDNDESINNSSQTEMDKKRDEVKEDESIKSSDVESVAQDTQSKSNKLHSEDEPIDSPSSITAPKMGKAAQKRAKKATAAATASAGSPLNEKTHTCATCHHSFPSKTQMFQHIKDYGHAALKDAVGSKGKKGKR